MSEINFYYVSQELANYVRKFKRFEDILSTKERPDISILEEIGMIRYVIDFDDNELMLKSYSLNEINNKMCSTVVKLWFADKYGYMKVKEPELYYVHFIEDKDASYLNISSNNNKSISTRDEIKDVGFGLAIKTKFTIEEIKAINPKYLEFKEKVEDDD